MESDNHEVTILLERMGLGDKGAENRLYEIVMPDLRRLAQHLMNGERPDHTLQATELVSRMYLRLAGTKFSLRDRGHFFAIAATAMRRELIDYARSRPHLDVLPLAGLPERVVATNNKYELALTIDELLDRMRETMPVECSIVEMKFFFGTTDEETAEILGLPLRSMQVRWKDARIWLFEKAEDQQWRPTKQTGTPKTT